MVMSMLEAGGLPILTDRVRQADEVGAKTSATACPFCMTMIDDGIKSIKETYTRHERLSNRHLFSWCP